jgi:SAM-dependent methyltransferase
MMTDNPSEPVMFNFYTRFYTVVASSAANAAYCERVYGRNFCQHGFADVVDLDHLIQVAEITADSRVLDLGCGNGLIPEYISDQTGAHFTGVDFIAKAIRDAQRRTAEKRERLDFRLMDFLHLDFPPASFDVIISIDTLYFTDIVETLRGCLPLLKENGRLAVFFDQSCGPQTPLEEYPREIIQVDRTELAQALQALGYSYQSWDYTEAMLAHLRRRRPVLEELKPQFEAEGNTFLYESHLGESLGIEHAYVNDAGKRYLYLASRSA